MRLKSILTCLFALALCAGTLLPAQEAQKKPPAEPTEAKGLPPANGPSSAIVTQATDQTGDTLAAPPVANAPQTERFSGYIDFGYRWLVNQNESNASYRTLVNLGEGPKFFGAHITVRPVHGNLWDRLQIDSTSWGGEPYSNAKLYATKSGSYDLSVQYRQQNYFSNPISFANPLLQSTAPFLTGQNAYDYKRRLGDADLTLFPNKTISPFFSYSHSGRHGPGYWPWIGPGNEYLVSTRFDDSTDLYRGGVHLNLRRFFVTVEGGRTSFSDAQQTFFTGFNPGNRRTPLFGTTMSLSSINQQYNIDGNMGFFRVSAKAAPTSWLDLAGQFGFSQASGTIGFTETATGLFVSPATPRTFTGLSSNAPGSALLPRPSGNASMILRPFRHLRIVDSFDTVRFHNAAGTVFSQTLTGVTGLLGTVQPPTVTTVTPDFTVIGNDYSRNQIEAIYEAFPWLLVRGGWRAEWSQWIQPGDAPGEFDFHKEQRNVGLGGITLRLPRGANVNFETEVGAPKRSLYRISLSDYHKVKVGARWNVSPWLRFNGKWIRFYNVNDTPEINLFSHNQEVTLALLLMPSGGKRVTLSFDWSYQNYLSNILAAIPFPPATVTSTWRQNASYAGSLVNLHLIRGATVNFGGSLLVTHGTRPTKYYQPRAEILLPLHRRVSFFTNWQYWDYNEKSYLENFNPLFPTLENFNANLFSIGLRINLGHEQ